MQTCQRQSVANRQLSKGKVWLTLRSIKFMAKLSGSLLRENIERLLLVKEENRVFVNFTKKLHFAESLPCMLQVRAGQPRDSQGLEGGCKAAAIFLRESSCLGGVRDKLPRRLCQEVPADPHSLLLFVALSLYSGPSQEWLQVQPLNTEAIASWYQFPFAVPFWQLDMPGFL